MDALEELRAIAGPLEVNSGYRCNEHNRKVGGSKNSYHPRNMAVDIYSRKHAPDALAEMAGEIEAFWYGGIGIYPTFVHVDIGPQRRWKGK